MILTTEPTRIVKDLVVRLTFRSRSKSTSPSIAIPPHPPPHPTSRRLQRLGQSIQRWRRTRSRHVDEHISGLIFKTESSPSHPRGTPQLEEFSEDCLPVGNTPEGTQQKDSSNESTSQEVIPQEPIAQPFISQEVIQQEAAPKQLLPPAKCVYRQTRDIAKRFAQSMMSACFTSGSDTRRIFWTDASLNKIVQQHHGGIAVAQLSGNGQWTIQHAHVTGLTNANDLEAIAVMMALETALQDEPAQPEVLIFCDNEHVLGGLEKNLAPLPAMQHAVQVYESTKDRQHALALFWESYELGRMEKSGDSSLLSPIRERTLAAYYQLLERGTTVQFHWVPAHEEILGNDAADQWANYARRWYMNALSTCIPLSDVMVFPMATVYRECNHLGLPMTGETVTEIQARENLEVSKDLHYSLSTSDGFGEAFTTTSTIVSTAAMVPSTNPHEIATMHSQLEENQKQITVSQTQVAVRERLIQRRKRRHCQKCGRKGHAAAHCEQRSLRASCALKGNSYIGDEYYQTRSTPPSVLNMADRLHRQLSRWRAWSFWPLLVEAIISGTLVLLIYVYGGGLAWLARVRSCNKVGPTAEANGREGQSSKN